MAFLIDLPVEPRRELAARWQSEETTDALYRSMTNGRLIRAHIESIDPLALRIVTVLAGTSLSRGAIASRVAASDQRLDSVIAQLGKLGIVLGVPRDPVAPPRFIAPPFDSKRFYVPLDIADQLRDR